MDKEERLIVDIERAMLNVRIQNLESALLSIRTIAEIAQKTNMVGVLHNHIAVIYQRASEEIGSNDG